MGHTAMYIPLGLWIGRSQMTPEQYKKVVIKVYCYGPNKNYSFTFDVVETGKFAYVPDSLTEL